MKTAIEAFEQPGVQDLPSRRRDWTGGTVLKVALAAVVLSLVYFLASWVPVDPGEVGVGNISGFLFFWILGGIFTITLLALSDRGA